jgi:hypothetical protein
MLLFAVRREIIREKARERLYSRGLSSENYPGGFLLSHTPSRAVPSAPRGLTSVFGMGTGVTLSTEPPENLKELLAALTVLDRI